MKSNVSKYSSLAFLCLATIFFYQCDNSKPQEECSLAIKGLNEKSNVYFVDFFSKDTIINLNTKDTIIDINEILLKHKFEYLNLMCFVKNKNIKFQEFIPFRKGSKNIIEIDLSSYESDYSALTQLKGSVELKIVDQYYKSTKGLKKMMYHQLNQEKINLKYLDSLNQISDSIGLNFYKMYPKNILSKLFVYNKLNNDPNYFNTEKLISVLIDSICKISNYKLNNIDLCRYYSQVSEELFEYENQDTNNFFLKAKNLNNHFQTLDSIHNKYILIDFWATWCKPCLKDIELTLPVLNSSKYKNDVEVVLISIDSDTDKWKKFVPTFFDTKKNVHLIDYNNITKQHYKIDRIPQNILLNKDKNIIGRNIKGNNLFSTLDVWIEND